MRLLSALVLTAALAAALPAAAVESKQSQAAIARAAAEVSGPSVLALYLAGNAAAGDGHFDKAADYFARATELATGEAKNSLREYAFQAAMQAGDIAKAAQLAPTSENGSQSSRQLGQLVVAVNDIATNDNTGATHILTGNGLGVQFRGLAALLRPWPAAAAGDKTQADSLSLPARADPVTRINTNYNKALLFEVAGQNDKVDDVYKDLLTNGPDFLKPQYVYSYGAFLERQGKADEAVKLYSEVLDKQPEAEQARVALERASKSRPKAPPPLTAKQGAATILFTQGMIALASNDPDTALYYFWLSLRLDDKRSDALYMAASLEASQGATEAAREHLGRIPRGAPEYVDARISITETWLAEDNNARALASARDTASRAPRDLAAKATLGRVYAISGKNKEAADAYSQVIRGRGDDADWGLYYARATVYNDMGDWRRAEADLMKALQISPDQPEVMNYLGYVWADRSEHLDQALSLLQKAARARPNEGAIIDSLGWAYFRMGDIPKAIENLEKAAELDAADPEVNNHLGDAYLSAGRKLEAVFQWQRVLTLKPDDKLKAEVQGKINAQQTVASAAPATAATP